MKKLCYCFLILAVSGFVLYRFGLYPVALVDGTPIFARTWQRILEAEEHVVNAHARSSGSRPVDFSSSQNSKLLDTIRRNTLTVLIDGALMRENGSGVVPNLEQSAIQRVNDELRTAAITEATASTVYGLDLAALKETVLVPQARQEILSDALDAGHRNFADWLADVRARAHVKFFFVPFQWDQEGVKERSAL